VRPDGYVAWRGASAQTGGGELLVHAIGEVLHLSGECDDVPHTNRRINEEDHGSQDDARARRRSGG
jgi:hypothetical protein